MIKKYRMIKSHSLLLLKMKMVHFKLIKTSQKQQLSHFNLINVNKFPSIILC